MKELPSMSRNVQAILGRAINDKEFREMLLTDFDGAIKDYELTKVEKKAVANLQEREIQEIVTEMARRMKATLMPGGVVLCDGQCA